MMLPVNLPNNEALVGTHPFLQDLHRIGNRLQFVATNRTEVSFDKQLS